MIKKISLGVLAIVFLILTYAYFQPVKYTISREIKIAKSAAEIFPYINNSKLVLEWAPWPDMDPELQMKFEGPEAGVGAKSTWDSPGKMGTGSATVIEVKENQLVRTQLEYTKPFAMSQVAVMEIQSQGAESTVIWSVMGENLFLQRVVCLFMDMDKMVGENFMNGLNKLKSKLEAI